VAKWVTGAVKVAAVFEILTKWFSLTRLETRTKESNNHARERKSIFSPEMKVKAAKLR
jgi:hypothetical protein